MQIAYRRMDIEKLNVTVERLMSYKWFGSGSRLAMSQKTLDGIVATLERCPIQYKNKHSNSEMVDQYNGVTILKDETLDFGEVLVLAEMF